MRNVLVVISFILSITLVGQNVNISNKEEFKKAKQLIKSEKYSEAIPHINNLLAKHDSPNYNYLMGKCLLNINDSKTTALSYLIKANKRVSKDYDKAYNYTASPTEAVFLLAQAYYNDYKFHKALAAISKYKKLEGKANEDESVKQFEKRCLNALKIYNNPVKIEAKKASKNINTPLNDFNPLLNADENMMVFTSNIEDANVNNIYISRKTNDVWSRLEGISSKINSIGDVTAVALSPDGNQLIIKKTDDGVDNLYISRYYGDWSTPEKLNENINTKYNETDASFSDNGDRLYFVSDRKGGFGGKDIYFSNLMPNGEWAKAQNMGEIINTEYNEAGVSIHYGGYTVFFSSDRPTSLGGYDLYFSDLVSETQWGKPQNMGYPLNTIDDNINYFISKDLKRAYTSYKKKNSKTGIDIYRINLLSSPKRTSVVIKGFIRDTQGNIVKDEIINLHERKSHRFMGSYTPNSEGEYTLILSEGLKYFISIDDDTKICSPKMISVPESASFYEIGKPVNVKTITVIQ